MPRSTLGFVGGKSTPVTPRDGLRDARSTLESSISFDPIPE
jgi:hypothetical protein